jgi:hypothetical protein
LPTYAQTLQATILCQWISNGFQPISVFRYDTRYRTIYIQGGKNEEISLVIYSDGEWDFV